MNSNSIILLFVDSSVQDISILTTQVKPGTQVYILDTYQDGIVQITTIIKNLKPEICPQEIHIVSHGAPGSLYLGNTALNLDTLGKYTSAIQTWFSSPTTFYTANTELFLYGCNIAAGEAGNEFISKLRHITGASITASTALVGSAAKGGSWTLDVIHGEVFGDIAIAPEAQASYAGILANPEITDSAGIDREVAEEGTLNISDLVITDEDNDPLTVTVTVSNGTLDSAGNLDTTHTFTGTPADVTTRLNALTYVGDENFFGDETLQITVNDGTSTVTKNVAIAVSAVNDTPTIAPSAVAVDEGSNVGFVAANFGITDVDNSDVQIIVKIHELPDKGTLTLSGSRLIAGSTFSYNQVESLVYTHDGTDTRVSGGTSDRFKVTVEDGAGGIISATEIPITIDPVNDPTNVSSNTTLFEGQEDAAINITLNDVDQTNSFDIKILSLPEDGELKLNGNTVVVNQTLSSADLNNLTYSHNGNDENNGFPPDDSFQIEVIDDGGGTLTPESTIATINLDIIPNNDDPTLATNTGTTLDTGTSLEHVITISELQVTDPDSTTTQLTFTLTEIPDADTGTLQLFNGTTWETLDVNTTFTQDDIDDGRLKYVFHKFSFGNESFADQFSFTVKDSEIREYPFVRDGGIYQTDTSNSPLETITFNIDITTTPPTITNPATGDVFTIVPDPVTGNPSIVDPNTGNSQEIELLAPPPSSNPADDPGGAIAVVPGTNTPIFTDGGGNPVPIDGGGGAGGTENPDVGPNTDPPTIASNTGISNLLEGDSITINNTMLSATDTDNTAAGIVYRVEQLPDNGMLKINGTAISRYGSFTQDDIDNGRVTFEHDGGEDFIDEFQFTVSDGKNVTFEQIFSIDVTPVNDRPTASVHETLAIAEDDSIIINNTYLSFRDVDGSGDKSGGETFSEINTLTFQITALPQHGTLTIDGIEITAANMANIVLTEADLANDKLVYDHDGTENFADSFSVQANDNKGQGNSLSNSVVVNIDIAKLNDNPSSLSAESLTVDEGSSGSIQGADSNGNAPNAPHILYNDPDNTTLQRQFLIKDATDFGTLTKDGQVLSEGSVFTQKDLDEGRISYEHDGSENHTDIFHFEVRDGGGDFVEGNYTININPINDAPALTVPTENLTFDTDTPYIFAPGDITVADRDINAVTGTDILTVTLDLQKGGTTYTTSTLDIGDAAVTIVNGTDNVAGGTITFQGTKDEVQKALDGLQVAVPDDEDTTLDLVVTVNDFVDGVSGAANGGNDPVNAIADYNIDQKIIKINASDDNDAPTITAAPTNVTLDEDTSFLFTGANAITIDDVDSFDSTNNTVELKLRDGNGKLALPGASGVTVTGSGSDTITVAGSIDAINTALENLKYFPTPAFNDTSPNATHQGASMASDILDITINDGGNTGRNGANTLEAKEATQSVNIVVTPVNDKPSIHAPNSTQTLATADPLAFSAANGNAITIKDLVDLNHGAINDFTVTLNIDDPSGTLSTNSNPSVPGAVITGSGASITLEGSKEAINAALEGLTYTPGNTNGDASYQLTVTVDDEANGGEAIGGIGGALTDSKVVNINVSSNNDIPVITSPATESTNEDMLLTFSNTNGNAISIADSDDFGGILTATLSADEGTLNLMDATGLTVTNNGTGEIVIEGTEAAINTALANGLEYQGTLHFNGADTLTIQVDDNGNTGIDTGAPPAEETIAITVNPVNDRPTATGSVILSSLEDRLNLPDSVLSDIITSSHYDDATIDDQTSNGGSNGDTDLSYVAIVGSTNYTAEQGTWQVSDGSNDPNGWIDIPSSGLSAATALIFPADRKIRFVPTDDFHGDPGDLTVRLADGSNLTIPASTSANDTKNLATPVNGGIGQTDAWSASAIDIKVDAIAPVNDAPMIHEPNTPATLASINEDTTNPTGATVDALLGNKYDDTIDNQTSITGGNNTETPFAGIAIVGNASDSNNEGTWQYNNGSGWVDIPDTGLSDSNALVIENTAQLRFVPVDDYNGDPGELTVRFSDGTHFSVSSGIDISGELGNTHGWSANTTTLETTVNPINDAPVLDNTPDVALPTIDEDPGLPSGPIGALVSDLITPNGGDAVSDVDTGAIAGIAVTNVQGGTLYYSTDDGNTWQEAPNPNNTASLLLAADGTTRVFFQPNENLNGTVTDALTIRAWDQTSGVNGGVANTITNGGTTPFSTETEVIGITVNPVNDRPELSNLGGSVEYTEGNGPVVLDSDATLSDVELDDFDNWNGASLTITRAGGANSDDIFDLSDVDTTIGTVTQNNDGTLIFTFNNDADRTSVNTFLQGIQYHNSNTELLKSSVTLEYTISDGNNSGPSGVQGSGGPLTHTGTVTVNITPLFTDIETVDEDSTNNRIETLTDDVVNPVSVTLQTHPSHGIVTLDTQGTTDPTDDVFIYTPNPDYQGPDGFTYTIEDGNGDEITTIVDLTVNPINDTPEFNNIDGILNVSENGSPVIIDGDASLGDIDLDTFNSNNGNWAGATLTIERQSGSSTDDVFGHAGTLNALTDGGNLVVDSTTVGTVVNNSNGTLTLLFNDNATNTLVDRVLQQITYSNSSEEPDAFVTLEYTISDGNDGNQGKNPGTGLEEPLTATTTKAIEIAQSNDEPVLTVASPLVYIENAPALVIDDALTLTDVDDTNLTTVTIAISNGFTPGDILTIDTSGTTISTNYDPNTGILTLTGTNSGVDTLENFESVMQTVAFSSNSSDPTENSSTRELTWSVTDADSDGLGASTTNLTTIVRVDPINARPLLDLDGDDSSATTINTDYQTLITPGMGGIAIADIDTQITDIDDTNIRSAAITLTTRPNGANESLTLPQTTVNVINSAITVTAYNPATGVLSLTGEASLADYTAVIEAITYNNSANVQDQDRRDRTITVVVQDAGGNTSTDFLSSHMATTTIRYDSDGDRIPDIIDIDDDNDGITDVEEQNGNPTLDTDGDGVIDSLDLDSDGDGVLDIVEAGHTAADTNQDGRVDGLPAAFGANGLIDQLENGPDNGPNYTPLDTDGDGVHDFQDLDSDNDGLNDVIEGLGIDLNGDGIDDRTRGRDTDGDGVPNRIDPNNGGTPLNPPDTDNDGTLDFRDLDSDNDGLPDLDEGGLDPRVFDPDRNGVLNGSDTDGDGILDSVDGTPNVFGDGNGPNSSTVPNSGPNTSDNPDYREIDSDGDGIPDRIEAELPVGPGTPDVNRDGVLDDPTDSDNDGIANSIDSQSGVFGGFDFTDTDQDGVPDSRDLDDDNDGILDVDEGDRTLDTDQDGIPDSIDLDSDNDGILDIQEAGHNQADINGDGRVDGPVGTNGFPDVVETSPDSSIPKIPAIDTDGDGVRDFQDLDSDNDGIPDVLEAGGSDPDRDGIIGTGTPQDIDNDGIANNIDASTGGIPLPVMDSDGDGKPDYRDLDSDNDGVFDLTERGGLADNNNDGQVDGPDSDGDGLLDAVDGSAGIFGTGPVPLSVPQDLDGDGVPDFRQLPPSGVKGGSGGADNVNGTTGHDILNGFSDLDTLDGGAGNDIINGGSQKDTLIGGPGDDTINGGTNHDRIFGNGGNDILNGGSGNDQILGHNGNDILNGGEGNDRIKGGKGRDIINGGDGNDKLLGQHNKDAINGGNGNDLIVGGFGKDKLTGGEGRDVFRYLSGRDFGDTITDFEIVKDKIDFKHVKGIDSINDLNLVQRGDRALIQSSIGNGFKTIVTLDDLDASDLDNRHFKF